MDVEFWKEKVRRHYDAEGYENAMHAFHSAQDYVWGEEKPFDTTVVKIASLYSALAPENTEEQIRRAASLAEEDLVSEGKGHLRAPVRAALNAVLTPGRPERIEDVIVSAVMTDMKARLDRLSELPPELR